MNRKLKLSANHPILSEIGGKAGEYEVTADKTSKALKVKSLESGKEWSIALTPSLVKSILSPANSGGSDWDNAKIKYHSPSGLWYKYVTFRNGERHILCSGDKPSLEKDTIKGHTHYWEHNGTWYSQENVSGKHYNRPNSPLGLDGSALARMMENIWNYLDG